MRFFSASQMLEMQANQHYGSDYMEYGPWKEAICQEMQAIGLDATQELLVLRKRTNGIAHGIMERTRYIQYESTPH